MSVGKIPFRLRLLACALALGVHLFQAAALTNGLALKPPMGFNAWYHCTSECREWYIKACADAMATNGLKDAGYQFINLDDCWFAGRGSDGRIMVETNRFPNGMTNLANYVHSKGLKFGIYLPAVINGSACFPIDVQGNEFIDASTILSYGADFLKYDFVNGRLPAVAAMWTAIRQAGGNIVFSLSDGFFESWMPSAGNMWRTSADYYRSDWTNVMRVLDDNNRSAAAAGPGHWNDPDILHVGPAIFGGDMTETEYRTHFGMWCFMAAPLIIGTDITRMSDTFKSILTAPELIAIDQDEAGVQGYRVTSAGGLEVWRKPLGKDGRSMAVALLNRTDHGTNMTVNWQTVGFPAGPAVVRDLWARSDLGVFFNGFSTNVMSHEAVILKLTTLPEHWGLLSAVGVESNRCELQVTSRAGDIWRLETSTNLATWSFVMMITNASGDVRVFDDSPAESPVRFYRLLASGTLPGFIADQYCAKAGVLSPQAQAGVQQFTEGLNELGLLTNLVDFAFLAEGQNTAAGDPVALHSTGKIVGSVNRLRGGFQLPNYADESSTNWMYFTNLPPTPDGRTIMVWGSQDIYGSRHAGGFGGHLFQITSPGGGPGAYMPAGGLYQSGGGLQLFTFNGSIQNVSPVPLLAYSNDNAFFCVSVSLSSTGNVARLSMPNVIKFAQTDTAMPASPSVLRFGTTYFQTGNFGSNCWNGLIRGWTYFDRVLSAAEMDAVDSLVPRIGVIVNGDGKSVYENGYAPFWVEAAQNWGLMSILTNSSLPNSISHLNSPGASFEERFTIDIRNFQTNSTYPMILYSVRGGIQDCDGFANTVSYTNGWRAVTNLWAAIRTNGMKAVAFTIDPVRQFTTPNSNNVTWWNTSVRNSSGFYDYLVDVDEAYRTTFGDSYTNYPNLYASEVVETAWGMAYCGTGVVAKAVSLSLGYEGASQVTPGSEATGKSAGAVK